MKHTINKIEDLEKIYNITFDDEDKKYLTFFFKKKNLQINNNKIIYPKLSEIKKIINELNNKLIEIKKEEKYWDAQKKNAESYHKKILLKMFLKKKFWQHNIKKIIDKDYKKDIIETKLTDQILMDPEYDHLFNTFLVDPDYRQKLKETIKTSIVYKNSNIGEYSIKKQEFKKEIAKSKMNQNTIKTKNLKFEIKMYNKIIELIKKHS